MAKKSDNTKRYPPVTPLGTVTNFIETIKTTVVPPVIDNSLLTKMSGSTRSTLMSALRYLGLTDTSGAVTERLRKLVAAYGTPGWKEAIIEELFEPFEAITGDLDLDNGTQAQLYDAFRTKGNVDGQMLEKAVRFYLAMLTEAGVGYSPHFKTRAIRKPSTKKKSTKKKNKDSDQDDDSGDSRDPLGDFDEDIWARFQIPIPGKGDAIIALPREIDAADWQMVSTMLDAYVQRLTKE